jgi:hypothetical protein
MNSIYTDKTTGNKSNAAANNVASHQVTVDEFLQLEDNRPETVAQKKIQEAANNSINTKQLKAVKSLANNSEQVKQLRTLQAKTGTKVLQKKELNKPVVQRTPDMWKNSVFITRVTGLAHGWFSTWKKIKEAINEYKILLPANLNGREEKLNFIKDQLEIWKAHEDHKATSTEQRVLDIIAILPQLEQLIENEENEVELARVNNMLKGRDLQSIWDSEETGRDYDPLYTKYRINASKHLSAFWRNKQRFTFMVPPQIIADLDGDDNAKVNTIFERINVFPFFYSGAYQPPEMGFLSKNGDCLTLAMMLQLAAKAAGVNNVTIEKLVHRHIVAKGRAHGRDKVGNVENEAYWTFRNHFWCTHNGTIYDLLFMKKALAKPHLCTGDDVYHEVKYELYEGDKYMIASDQHDTITKKKLSPGSQGVVFDSLVELKLYIDTNK